LFNTPFEKFILSLIKSLFFVSLFVKNNAMTSKRFKYTPKERQSYENSLKYYRDMENSFDLKYAKGLQEGKEEGLKEGLLLTARNMKSEGFSPAQIAKVTRLTENEIEAL
jgi:predicted transposase/invertase (TIGR01784 family)